MFHLGGGTFRLLEKGVTNETDDDMSPLHVAAEGGHLCTVHLLLCATWTDSRGLGAKPMIICPFYRANEKDGFKRFGKPICLGSFLGVMLQGDVYALGLENLYALGVAKHR